MNPSSPSPRDVFLMAVKLPPEQWDACLAKACADDADLRRRVAELLRSHQEIGTFMDSPAVAVGLQELSLNPPILLTPPGTMIGRYKILEPIGEGGYGTVFMAEQTTPVQRKVALKIIKAGMDTRQVIARFEAERQALALMDHPNIAKVFDAGVTDSGRPYFVMELVKGIAITKYCDEHHLTPRDRLELFMQVCQAVQHAHQKGIIHRDLKPSNVLVAQYDGKPVPKVIDFGVAKATGQSLTDLTMFTGFGDVIGTLEYMSPEQAEVNQLDVDTRSDIYSLGVLLYELLTGTTPLEHKRVMKAGLLEMLRVVREEEPPKPSMRLTTTAELPSIAANRGLEPKKLSGLVHGELDWIVMKALEKDRGQRYETASGLARDVERYLCDEAVQACPPSATYRLRKLARRHRIAVFAALTLVAILIALVAGLTVTNRIITKSRNETAAALRLKEQALREAQAERQRAEANFLKARVAVDQLLTKPALGGGGQQADEQLPASFRKKLVEVATKFYTSLGDEHSSSASLRFDAAVGQRSLGFVYQQTGDLKRSEELLRRAISTLQALHQEHPDRPEYRQQLGWSHYMLSQTLDDQHRSAEALVAVERAREIYERLIAEHPQDTNYPGEIWWVYGSLAPTHAAAGRMEDAAEMYSRRVKINPAAHSSWYAAAGFYLFMGDVERYRDACREMLDRFEKRAEEDADIASLTARICALIPDAVVDFSRVERLSKRSLTGTEKDPFYRDYVLTGALIDYRGKRYAQVVDTLSRHTKPDGNVSHATAFAILAMAHHRLGHADQAQASLKSARAIIGRTPPDTREWQQCQILLRQAEQLLAERKEVSN